MQKTKWGVVRVKKADIALANKYIRQIKRLFPCEAPLTLGGVFVAGRIAIGQKIYNNFHNEISTTKEK